MTVILLSCAYNEQEFVRIGYYVNTEFEEGTPLRVQWDEAMQDPPVGTAPDPASHVDKLRRNVLADKPRVTKFNIKWSVAPLPWPSPAACSARRECLGDERRDEMGG